MYQESDLRCKVCGGLCSIQDWERTKSCTSCQEFYQRSTEKMNRWAKQRNATNDHRVLAYDFTNLISINVDDFLISSSKSFSYYCTCMENCSAKGSIECNWNSGKRNHCKQCRYKKYQTTWMESWEHWY